MNQLIESITNRLDIECVDYIVKTDNLIEVITFKGEPVDYYVSTSTFIPRNTKQKSKGLNNMLRYIKSN